MLLTQATEIQNSTPSLLSLSPKEQSSSSISFAELLKGVKLDKDVVQNGLFTLSLEKDGIVQVGEHAQSKAKDDKPTSKQETLLSLLSSELKGEDIEPQIAHTDKKESPIILNPELTKQLTPKELQQLIRDAKQYLKDKITQSVGYKKAQTAELPKTLKGLVKLAESFGMDLSKITLEEVRPHKKEELISELPDEVKPHKIKKAKQVAQTDTQQQDNERSKEQVREDIKRPVEQKAIKEIKSLTLFKTPAPQEHTTEQLVQSKIAHVEQKTKPKQKADETLQLLLRGEKIAKDGGSKLGVDFAASTAKVVAPQAKTEQSKEFDALLRGDSSDNGSDVVTKHEGVQTLKSDSLEVKVHEAKQMTKYLSADVKNAIEDYKAPFTRVKVQLNPQKLGEIDLTIVQRGKNLHINLSSNNAAINALAMNANDLKVQLQHNGIQNASLNFNNNNAQGDAQQQQQGQQNSQQQHKEQAGEEYNYFHAQEEHEEVVNSLEIVVPYYA